MVFDYITFVYVSAGQELYLVLCFKHTLFGEKLCVFKLVFFSSFDWQL